jgi:hypothetical protein
MLVIMMMLDAGKHPFGSGTVAGDARLLVNGNQVFGSGEDKDVLSIGVPGNAVRGVAADARDAQAPAQAKRSIAVPRAVREMQVRLEAVATGGKRDWYREVAGTRLQVRRKLLANAVQSATPFRQCNNLA